ncbi:MAG: acyl carrier protein [Ramlibacter sp.]|jgi:acyl carrier protein|uniref:phosphopantetheine-binding protein n=1 Tax=Ramlibacter sp. TaxID=1917967 RepID=UPI002603C9B5|nr:phosphopantetheine-binding protein [Ramlibacter sp.]MDB5752831.1 acyl carrier protein [Ramlibacter sp.]
MTLSLGDRTAVGARELAVLLVEGLHLEEVDAQTVDLAAPLFGGGLDLDSLDMLEISLIIQQRYGVKLKADNPDNEVIFGSLESLAAHIGAARAQA